MAESHKLDYFCSCFLVAGHTKFAPDHLVTLIANTYNRKDISTDAELQQVWVKFSTLLPPPWHQKLFKINLHLLGTYIHYLCIHIYTVHICTSHTVSMVTN